MALDFFTGFDHYATADLLTGRFFSMNAATIQGSIARTGPSALNMATSTAYVTKTSLGNAATRIVGGAFRFAGVTDTRCIMALSDGEPRTAGNVQVGIRLNTDGTLGVYRGVALSSTGGTQLGSNSASAMTANTWHYIELVVTVHASAGTVEVFVNGTKTGWIDLTGQNTQSTANAYANAFGLGVATNAINHYWDDVYCVSGTGGTHTTRLGDVKCVAVNASTGNGTNADFTPSSGVDRGAMVDETTPDGVTTYNSAATAPLTDTYNFPVINTTGVIYATQVHNYASKSDAGVCEAAGVTRIGATNYVGTARAMSTTYNYYTDMWETSPATAVAWTEAEIDGAEFGIRRTL